MREDVGQAGYRSGLVAAQRVVVKLGSAVVAPDGRPDDALIDRVAADIAGLRAKGIETVVVSSGAVACGLAAMGLSGMPIQHTERQAAATLGQPALIARWARAFASHGIMAGQVLLTADDFEARSRFLNATYTLNTLLDRGAVPIVNENDSVAFHELNLGDNDRLSALVASAIGADALLLLSAASGLEDSDGRLVPLVEQISSVRSFVRNDISSVGTGGMTTKLDAASIAMGAGVATVIAKGREEDVIARILNVENVGTYFAPRSNPDGARRRWIGSTAKIAGTLRIDAGAVRALQGQGASLLPIGVTGVEGAFESGSAVRIIGPGGEMIGRGLTSYDASEARLIAGKRTEEIEPTLGYIYASVVVHRDDLSLGHLDGVSE